MSSNADLSVSELQEVANRIKALRRAATQHAVEIGRELLRVKERLPHGVFVKWVEKACEFKIRTAQDLMKLAREAEADTRLIALMVPSTLRVYLAKTTPAAVRNTILERLENGERVSRSELSSRVSDTRMKARAMADGRPSREGFSVSFLTSPEPVRLPDANRADIGGDRARTVAELILGRLSSEEYKFIMEGMNWEVWNRALVWMRAGRAVDPSAKALPKSIATFANKKSVIEEEIV